MKILIINTGSSSIKYRLYDMPGGIEQAAGLVEKIGAPGSRIAHRWIDESTGASREIERQPESIPDHVFGLRLVVDLLRETLGEVEIDAIGHRVVHGGEAFSQPMLIDVSVLDEIRRLTPLAPLHNPANILGIEVALAAFEGVPQVAVFDTAFHQTMPRRAFLYPLPKDWYHKHGVRRYGFHGSSHRYVARKAAQFLGKPPEELNLITLHLGNGASAAAVGAGKCVDTSMGLTPLEGLVMGTRCGDIDPAIPFHIHRVTGKTMDEIEADLNRESGMKGMCGESDMRHVRERARAGDDSARLALNVYAYRIRKTIGAYSAVLGRVDAIVFTAGIGENSPELRAECVAGLEPWGIRIDEQANRESTGDAYSFSQPDSTVALLVVATNEELEIASSTYECVGQS